MRRRHALRAIILHMPTCTKSSKNAAKAPAYPLHERVLGGLVLYFLGVVTLGILRGESSFERYMALKDSEATLGSAVDDLEAENRDTANEITKLKKSPSYAAKVLRDRYHITEEDERIEFFGE